MLYSLEQGTKTTEKKCDLYTTKVGGKTKTVTNNLTRYSGGCL